MDQIEELKKILICPICTDDLDEPMMTLCGHHFCFQCWSKYKSLTKGETCPLCRRVCIYPAIENKLLTEVLGVVFKTKKRKRTECKEKDIIRKIYHSFNKTTVLPFGYKKYFDRILESSCLEDLTLCQCGLLALERKVRKQNKNHGRPFYSCPIGYEGCGFFEWLDVVS